jgi:hypothetical protein
MTASVPTAQPAEGGQPGTPPSGRTGAVPRAWLRNGGVSRWLGLGGAVLPGPAFVPVTLQKFPSVA